MKWTQRSPSKVPKQQDGRIERIGKANKRELADPPASRWSTALLMMSSALLGATAVAVWNRRTITQLRNQFELEGGSFYRKDLPHSGTELHKERGEILTIKERHSDAGRSRIQEDIF